MSKQFELEGVVAKRLDSIYEPGRRSHAWVKVKHTTEQEFVVGGWLPGERGRSGTVGSLLIGYYEGEGDATRPALCGPGRERPARPRSRVPRPSARRARARRRARSAPGRRRRARDWIDPVLVVQVKFGNWTAAGGVRAPVFMGYRTDKPAEEVVREVLRS